MLGFFDSHAHYNDDRFLEDRDPLLKRLNEEENISYIMNVSYDLPSSYETVKLTKEYDFVYGAVGIHPHDSKDASRKAYEELKILAKNPKIKAIGESGLDYFYDHSEREIQKREFANHLELADELNLPIIVHERDATKDALDIVNAHENTGVFHCYSGSVETARILLNKGYYISLAGPVTFKNAVKTKEVAAFIPEDMLLIETDCPYLAPEPKRGGRNSSEYLKYIAQTIADLRGVPLERMIEISNQNARRLFKI